MNMKNSSCTDILKELQVGSGLKPHYRFHPRVWEHQGVVIDLGCGKWDWSRCFLGIKRVIGCDPTEKTIPVGAELFQGFLGPFWGKVYYQVARDKDFTSGLVGGYRDEVLTDSAEMITLAQLIHRFKIDSINLLKMNIEGMEYGLLIDLPVPVADQLVVSFHDFKEAPYNNRKATEAIITYLSQWYDWCCSDERYSWYVFLRR